MTALIKNQLFSNEGRFRKIHLTLFTSIKDLRVEILHWFVGTLCFSHHDSPKGIAIYLDIGLQRTLIVAHRSRFCWLMGVSLMQISLPSAWIPISFNQSLIDIFETEIPFLRFLGSSLVWHAILRRERTQFMRIFFFEGLFFCFLVNVDYCFATPCQFHCLK